MLMLGSGLHLDYDGQWEQIREESGGLEVVECLRSGNAERAGCEGVREPSFLFLSSFEFGSVCYDKLVWS
jgi:hypothetical protein